MTETSSRTIRLHGFEKTWSQSYKLEQYRFHISLLHSREALYMQGLLTLENGLYVSEKAWLSVQDSQGQLIGKADISNLGRFTLLVDWTKEYLLTLNVSHTKFIIDKLIIT